MSEHDLFDDAPALPFDELLVYSQQVKFLIYVTGGIARKSACEDALMARFPDLTRYYAHMAQNHLEYHLIMPWSKNMQGGYDWTGPGPRPRPSDWPGIDWQGCRCKEHEIDAEEALHHV